MPEFHNKAISRDAAHRVIDSASGRTSDMHSRVRQVLKHHRLSEHGNGVIEADLIEAVLASIAEARQEPPSKETIDNTARFDAPSLQLGEVAIRQERLRFEAWARANGMTVGRDEAGYYDDDAQGRVAWHNWLARAQQPQTSAE